MAQQSSQSLDAGGDHWLSDWQSGEEKMHASRMRLVTVMKGRMNEVVMMCSSSVMNEVVLVLVRPQMRVMMGEVCRGHPQSRDAAGVRVMLGNGVMSQCRRCLHFSPWLLPLHPETVYQLHPLFLVD